MVTYMRSKTIIFIAFIVFAVSLSACGGGTTPAANSNTAAANAPKTNANSSNPLDTTKAAPEETKNNAPTLSPVFKAYCAAIKSKNEADIRKIYSQETLKFFESQMKADKVSSLLKYLENDKVDKICDARNEVITGDKAVAEIKADWCPNGIKVVFVKENGEWKMTNKSPDIDGMKSSGNANTSK